MHCSSREEPGSTTPTKQLVSTIDRWKEEMEEEEGSNRRPFHGCAKHVNFGMLQGVVLAANYPQL
jgi:hypothetical protein